MSGEKKAAVSGTVSGGIGISGLLTITLIVLKLTDQIGWSWWWVTVPMWWLPALVLLFVLACYLMWLVDDVWSRIKGRR